MSKNGQSGTSSQQGQQPEDEHIDALLSEWAEKRRPLTEDETEALASRMASHLITCDDCQDTLLTIIIRLTEYAGQGTQLRERGTRLLDRFEDVILKAHAVRDLPKYAEAFVTNEEAARASYPETVEHLEECAACRARFDSMVATLKGQQATPQE